MKNTTGFVSLVTAVAVGLSAGCGKQESASKVPAVAAPAAPTAGGATLATVNGIAITEADLRGELRGGGEGHQPAEPAQEQRRNALEGLINQELAAQKAAALRIDSDPVYLEELRRMEAQLRAMKRRRLSEVYYRKQVDERAVVADDEARRYFEDNAALMRTELHVWQILVRDEAKIQQIAADLASGKSFDEVAGALFPQMPPSDRKPWDMGYLRWNQVPEQWREVAGGLEKGQASGIIRGPKNRFWIIKLIDRRENPEITFDNSKPIVVEYLRNEKLARLREETDRSLRSGARVVYSKAAVAAPKP